MFFILHLINKFWNNNILWIKIFVCVAIDYLNFVAYFKGDIFFFWVVLKVVYLVMEMQIENYLMKN